MGTSVFTREYHKLIGLNAGQPTLSASSGWNFGSGDPIDRSITVASSVNLMVVMLWTSNGQVPTSMTWDQGGTNQSLTESSPHRQSVGPGGHQLSVWYLFNPTPGTSTFRIVNNGGIAVVFDISQYIGAASTLAAALPSADVQKGTTTSGNQWNVTQSADESFSFDVSRKIGIIQQGCENGVSNGFSATPTATSIDSFHGASYLRQIVSPVSSRITPNTQPDGGLGGVFFTISGP